jgi:Novel toxin 21
MKTVSKLVKAFLVLVVLLTSLRNTSSPAHATNSSSKFALNNLSSTDLLSLFGLTNKEARDAAAILGYEEVKGQFSSKQLVFKHKKKNLYISADIDVHNGGVWKMADSVVNLGSKTTRIGTFDANLNKIGD